MAEANIWWQMETDKVNFLTILFCTVVDDTTL